MTARPPIRRVRDGAEADQLCEPHQPAALLVSSPLHEAGAGARCWAVGAPGHELGLLTAVPVRPGLVTASVLLHDPGAAPALAALVRRSGAGRLHGGAGHVDPVAALLPGARATPLELLARHETAPPAGDWPERGRVAGPDDVAAVVALYARFELEVLAPARVEAAVAGLVARRRVVVAVEDGVVVGAQRVEARSRRWDLWAGLTVPPEHRGRGLSRVVDAWARELSRTSGRGTAGVRAPTNHVPHAAPGLVAHPWREVRVPLPRSLPRRARRWAGRQVRRAGTGR